jgi:hypothetical protein
MEREFKMTTNASISKTLAEARRNDKPEYYAPEDDCTTGLCDLEGFFIQHEVGNFKLDKEFVGSQIDTELDLDLANVDTMPLSDELFPPILDAAPITLIGLMDCFARNYPERAQLLATLVEKNGYKIEWLENPSNEELQLQQQLDTMPRETYEWHGNSGGYTYSPVQQRQRTRLERTLEQIQHWRITDNKILLMPRINKNIDKFNWFGIDDDELIYQSPTNTEGADWLNAVMGDWMVRNGILKDGNDEEFTDSHSSRIAWGSLNVVLGAAEVVGGVLLIPTGAASFGVGAVAGAAMTVAGVDAFTQGLDMLWTPEESAHGTGWLGDGVKAMATQFGHTSEDNYASFDKYWGFAMVGLSLGGAGVVAALPKAAQKVALGNAKSVFHTAIESRALTHAKKALAGVKNASFGKFKISFVTLPSARTVFNIKGVGRIVAPSWESLPRLRLRFIVDDIVETQERGRKLGKGEAGLVSLRGGLENQADVKKLVDETAAAMGVSQSRLKRIVSKVEIKEIDPEMLTPARSSFNGHKVIKIRSDLGTPLNSVGEYNEFRAVTEVMHEIKHALRYDEHLKLGKKPRDYWVISDAKYWQEEALVEEAAQSYMRKIAEPRVAEMRQHGNIEKANELESRLFEAIQESNEYILEARRKAGL